MNKSSKYNLKKTKKQIALEYLRTIFLSIVAGTIITTALAFHARNVMIKDLYTNFDEEKILDKKLAEKLLNDSNLTKDLATKKYSICINVGELYESVGDYKKAQYAYETALHKTKPNNYKAYYKLFRVLVAQENFQKANSLLNNIDDTNTKHLIKFKTKAYLKMGDKYYSISKFLQAAHSYKKANYYYNMFSKKDEIITKSIEKRLVNSYIKTSDTLVKNGMNTDAVRFLKKAEKYSPNNNVIKYKLAIVLSDSDPEKAVEYFDELLDKIPQKIDNALIGNTLLKAANIAELDGRTTIAKYYRYKIHSIDLFLNQKVVYKNDIDVELKSYSSKKVLFTYPLKAVFKFYNNSTNNITNLYADFVLLNNEKPVETVFKVISSKDSPLLTNSVASDDINVKFRKKIFTQSELGNYSVEIYLYKDKKYKTLVSKIKVPTKHKNLFFYEIPE